MGKIYFVDVPMIIGTFEKLPAAVSFEGKSATNVPSMTGCHLEIISSLAYNSG